MEHTLKNKRVASATRSFLERLDPDREHWVLGAMNPAPHPGWRWRTFSGPMRGPLAERWIAARYAEGVEVWLVLGDVGAPVEGCEVSTDAVTSSRFIAAVSHQEETFLAREAGNPLTIFKDGGRRYTAVWMLPEPVGQTEAVRLSGRYAAACCYKNLRAWPQLHYIPLPGDMRPSGLRGSVVRVPIHGRSPVEYDAPLLLPAPAAVGGPAVAPVIEAHALTVEQSVSLASVEASHIDWLWPGRIARKKLHLIGGEPGKGKSQFCAFLAARVTAGGPWPCGAGQAPGGGGVLWFGSEEDPAEEIRPRVEAAGADVRRIRVLRPGWRIVGGMDELDREASMLGNVGLLVLDPINSAIGSGAGSNDTLRDKALSPLMAWAARRNVPVVGVIHPPKNVGVTPATMFGSFKAYREVARVTLFAAADESDPGRMLLLLDKANALTPEEKRAHAYRIVSVTLPSGIAAPRIEFEPERVGVTADGWTSGKPAASVEVIDDDDTKDDGEGAAAGGQTQVARACQFLVKALTSGPRLGAELKAEAAELGIPGSTLDRAADEFLGVVKTGSNPRAPKTWSLP
jgi:putative DNA primase/helicase